MRALFLPLLTIWLATATVAAASGQTARNTADVNQYSAASAGSATVVGGFKSVDGLGAKVE